MLLFLLLILGAPLLGADEDPFPWYFDGTSKSLSPGSLLELKVSFSVPQGHFLYREKMSLTLEALPGVEGGFELGGVLLPTSVRRRDPFFEKEMDVYLTDVVIGAPLSVLPSTPPGDYLVKLTLGYQGCSESFCYRQKREEILLPVAVVGTTVPTDGTFFQKGFLIRLGLSFAAGLATDFTPCVLPIIPITLAFIGVRRGSRRRTNLVSTMIFVVAMALTYAALGIAASLLGKSLGFFFQNVVFLAVLTVLYVLFSLALFGLFEMQLPLPIRNWLAKRGGKGVVGSITAGITLGFLAAPCVGPLIASLLIYVAKERDAVQGFVLLLSYGLGMGSLFLVVSVFYEVLASRIHGGPATLWIRRGLAVLILIPAIYYGSIVWGHVRSFSGVPVRGGAGFWVRDAQEGLKRASLERKPILIDFYATWCLPCVEMERRTFSDPKVHEVIDRVIPIQVDCTTETTSCREMVERFGVIGWPTVLFLDPDGSLLESIAGRIVGPEEMRGLISRYSE